MRHHGWWAVWSVLSIAMLGAGAKAQTEGFALNRYDPPERGSDWMVGDSLDFRGPIRGGWGLTGDYGYKPLVLYRGDEDSVPIIRHQLFTHLGGTLVLWERLRLGVNWPILLLSKGDSITIGSTRLDAAGGGKAGDLRLGADVRLLGEYAGVFSLAIGARFHLPTGSVDSYASDGKARIEPRLMAAGAIGAFVYSARLSFLYRALHGTLTNKPFGSELGFAASAGARLLDHKLVLGPELFASTVVQKKSGFFKKSTTPMEVILSAKYHFGDMKAGLGVGPGLTRGYGTPGLRLLASIEWYPPWEEEEPEAETPPDLDHDGIVDALDACPTEPGVPSDDPALNGCPPPPDRDGDSIVDQEDACPALPGAQSDDPAKNGCPLPADRDGDSIVDGKDACPDEPGAQSDDPAKNGCPLPADRDGDSIIDEKDACPDQAGVANEDPKKNGCPVVVVTEEQIVVNDRIEFETNKATLRPGSDAVLNNVLKVLQEHPEIAKLSVEGHTDDHGSNRLNLILSRRRAASVVQWLVDHGIDRARLSSTGFGEDRPIDTNATEAGRQNNRRVEFKIVKQ